MLNEHRKKKTVKLDTYYDIIIVEGTFIFHEQKIRDFFNLKIYLDTDEDVRLSRRVYKDVYIKKKDLMQTINKYLKNTKRGYELYTLPYK